MIPLVRATETIDRGEIIDRGNAEGLRRVLAADPVLIDVRPAGDVIEGFADRMTTLQPATHRLARMCGPMQEAIAGKAESWQPRTLRSAMMVLPDANLALISKPPSAEVAAMLAERLAGSAMTFTVCSIGAEVTDFPAQAVQAHPLRDAAMLALAAALGNDHIGVVLLDVILGNGAYRDPAGHLADSLQNEAKEVKDDVALILSIIGVDGDLQNRAAQIATLERAGVRIAPSNAVMRQGLPCRRWHSGRDQEQAFPSMMPALGIPWESMAWVTDNMGHQRYEA